MPDEGKPGHLEMLEARRRLFEEHQIARSVVLKYDTQVSFGLLSDA